MFHFFVLQFCSSFTVPRALCNSLNHSQINLFLLPKRMFRSGSCATYAQRTQLHTSYEMNTESLWLRALQIANAILSVAPNQKRYTRAKVRSGEKTKRSFGKHSTAMMLIFIALTEFDTFHIVIVCFIHVCLREPSRWAANVTADKIYLHEDVSLYVRYVTHMHICSMYEYIFCM